MPSTSRRFDQLSDYSPLTLTDPLRPLLSFCLQELQYGCEPTHQGSVSASRSVEPAMEPLDMIRACGNAFLTADTPQSLGLETIVEDFRENAGVSWDWKSDAEDRREFVTPCSRDLTSLATCLEVRESLRQQCFKCRSGSGEQESSRQHSL
jgi:hypothetical protein